MELIQDKIDKNKVPKHIAIIMDGNGRWAAQRGKARIEGHQNGVEAVRSAVEGAGEIGVKHLTLYAFSTENWDRPKEEVDALMGLLVQAIEMETEELNKNNVRLSAIGNIKALPPAVQEKLQGCIDQLASNTGLNLILALSYGSRWEIVDAVKRIAASVQNNELKMEDIDIDLFGTYLSTGGIPDPELLIRTSGEFRVSNFLLWQIAYSELYFTSKLWPDFRKEDLFEAIADFQRRERRFGKTSEQITS